jgi:hypothetical protein
MVLHNVKMSLLRVDVSRLLLEHSVDLHLISDQPVRRRAVARAGLLREL